MRTNKEAAADWRPRRHQMANTQSHFSLRTNANTIETIIQFCGERMGPRENPPAIPDALFDRSAFAKGRSADPQPVDPRFLKWRFEKVRTTSSTGPGRIGARMSKHDDNGQTNRGSSIRTRP